MQISRKIGLLASLAFAAGCTSGQTKIEPGITSDPLTADRAQIAVGIATFVDGSKGLNVVGTFRQPNGLSAVLADTPTITGPAGFSVPASTLAGTDGGSNRISGSLQVPPGQSATKSTFGTSGGVFSYGFAPVNSTTSGAANFSVYDGTFYDATTALSGSDSGGNPIEFRGGPPSYPNPLDGTYPSGFSGFSQGFTTFAVTPVAGTYGFTVSVSSSNTAGATITGSSGTIASVAGLGAIAAAPTFTPDGAGGGTAKCGVPAAATETLVDLTDITAGTYYTVVVQGGGAVSATFASNLGVVSSGVAGRTIKKAGDEYSVSCVAVNYPAFESGPPSNRQILPTITGANGQADISFSPNFDAVY